MRIVVLNSVDFKTELDWLCLLNKLGIPQPEQKTTISVCFEVKEYMYHVDDGVKVDCLEGKV